MVLQYFFHMDYDTVYNPKAITRKLKFLRKNKVECVYNASLLCYDFYQKDLYKSDSPYSVYEGTFLHTKNYWKNGGFKWSDISNEGRFFSDNHGPQRKMDNYYDSVKILSIHNIQEYKPVKIDTEKSEFKYELKKDIIEGIQITKNPVKDSIDELFKDLDNIGTPKTGILLYAANIPGRWAAPPAPAIITSIPFDLAFL